MVIGIIGAGASGMAAAITAAQNPENQILLFERQARVGRKLLATGNGRCNLTNLHLAPTHYHGEDPAFCAPAISAFDEKETLRWFQSLGLYTIAEPSGRVYPYSDSANSVVDVLRFALQKPNIRLYPGFEVLSARMDADGFSVIGSETFHCDKLIIACGGLAGTKLGGSMSGYHLLKSFHHPMTRLRPALVQLKSSWSGISALKGVRANCKASVYKKDALFAESTGQVQFTEYGLSGPVIFEVSRDACQGPGPWRCELDLVPEVACERLAELLAVKKATELPCEELLTGILHNRLGRVIVSTAGIPFRMPIADLTAQQLSSIAALTKAFPVTLTEPLGMDSAQVTAGGMRTSAFDPVTMESRFVHGLYACGEVLDIDGDCGGYNLQWAWSSGHAAGKNAGGIS